MGAQRLYEFGRFRLDPAERRLLRDSQPVALTPKCFDLLVVLVENGGHLLGKEELLERVWPGQFVEEVNLSFNISSLRKALGEGQDGQRFIETVPKKGFRFVARVQEHRHDQACSTEGAIDETAKEVDGSRSAVPPQSMPSAKATLNWKLTAGLLAAGTLVFLAYAQWTRRAGVPAQPTVRTLAVLPFKPLGTESRDESLELGMADTLITRLSNVRRLVVRPMTAVRKYADTSQDPVKAGRELRTEAVLDGSIQKAGDRVRVTVRLMNVESGATLWAEQFDEYYKDIFKVQDSISGRVIHALLLKLSGDEEGRLAKRYTNDPEAYQLFLQAGYLRDRMDFQKSLELYQRAIEKDPNFALAYVGLADSYTWRTNFPAPRIRFGRLRRKPKPPRRKPWN
jgi:DNA-binding winged helix-turn-helix (wHTH) protein/TolB-like protein